MRRWLLRAALSNLLFLFFLWLYGPGELFSGGKERLFLTLYGNCASLSEWYFLNNLIFCILPLLLYIYVFSSYFAQDFKTSFVYVFTRSGSRSRWLGKRVAVSPGRILHIRLVSAGRMAVSIVCGGFSMAEFHVHAVTPAFACQCFFSLVGGAIWLPSGVCPSYTVVSGGNGFRFGGRRKYGGIPPAAHLKWNGASARGYRAYFGYLSSCRGNTDDPRL